MEDKLRIAASAAIEVGKNTRRLAFLTIDASSLGRVDKASAIASLITAAATAAGIGGVGAL